MEHTIAGLCLNLSFFNRKCCLDARLICVGKSISVLVNFSVSGIEATAESLEVAEPICKESPSLKLCLDDAQESVSRDTPRVMSPTYLSPTKSSLSKERPRLQTAWLKARSAEKARSAGVSSRESRRTEARYDKDSNLSSYLRQTSSSEKKRRPKSPLYGLSRKKLSLCA